ncbi:hypothetical protein [Brevibacillus brevis]|uniref:hypothetical protein n=1 Tax=Brevibacillus brevis TaxID=1393 RepID=UPI00165E8166|nr:hypothetical protein [Brevibacillus brevis]
MSTYDFAKKHRFQPLDIEDSYSGIERKPVQDTSRSFELVFLFTETFTWMVRLYGQEFYWHELQAIQNPNSHDENG